MRWRSKEKSLNEREVFSKEKVISALEGREGQEIIIVMTSAINPNKTYTYRGTFRGWTGNYDEIILDNDNIPDDAGILKRATIPPISIVSIGFVSVEFVK